MSQVLFLIGYMASGKSTLAQSTAQELQIQYLDTDDAIELDQNNSIYNIFNHYGESYFRTLESKWLHQFNPTSDTIVSTGGGMPCYHDSILLMRAKGTVVYLQNSIETLVNRLSTSNSRPLISNQTPETLQSFIAEHLAQRELYYKMAHYIIPDTSNALVELKTIWNQSQKV